MKYIIILAIVLSSAITACYKKVERVETVEPRSVVVIEHPADEVIVHDVDSVQRIIRKKKRVTVYEHK